LRDFSAKLGSFCDSINLVKETNVRPIHTIAATLILILMGFMSANDLAAQTSHYSVQVATCTKEETAQEVVEGLKRKGYSSAYVFTRRASAQRTWYVVRLGDYASLGESFRAAEAYRHSEKAEALITAVGSLAVIRQPKQAKTEPKAAAAVAATASLPKTASVPKPAPEKAAAALAAQPAATVPTLQLAQGPPAPAQNPPPAPEPATPPTEAAPAPAAPAAKEMDDLQEKIKTLEQQVDQLQQQAEVRKKLEITEEEKSEKEKEILSSAGRQYTLLKRNTLGLEYDFNYTYYSFDVINESTTVEQRANHTLTNSLFTEYALLDNVTLNLNVPFVYKYDKTGTDKAMEVTDLGDVTAGLQYQPIRSGGSFPALILIGRYTFPMGRSPYDINPDHELATGQGYASADGALSLSKTIDPIIAFGTFNYTYNFEAEDLSQVRSGGRILTKVKPGQEFGLSVGIGFAMSYKVSLNMAYQYVYRLENEYFWQDSESTLSGTSVSSVLSLGTGWRLSPKFSMYFKVGIGLTDDDPDFIFSMRLPFEFGFGS
jgi:flagellar motor protein MotB